MQTKFPGSNLVYPRSYERGYEARPSSRVLKKSFSEEKTCKKPNVFEGQFSKTAIFQQPAMAKKAHATLDPP